MSIGEGGDRTQIADPLVVAEIHAEPWRAKWGAGNAIVKRQGFEKVNVNTFIKLRNQFLDEAKEFAND